MQQPLLFLHSSRTWMSIVICRLDALQVVTDKMWEARASRFPEHTPNTREYYLLRSIFEEQFPSQQAMATVPKVYFLLQSSPCYFPKHYDGLHQQLNDDANGDSNWSNETLPHLYTLSASISCWEYGFLSNCVHCLIHLV